MIQLLYKYVSSIFGVLFLILALMQIDPVTKAASDYSKEVTKSAATTYIALRGINAALSFVEEFEVGISIPVTGTLQPFKILEPMDDAVERLSATVFYVGVAAGIITAAIGFLGKIAFFTIGLSLITFDVFRRSRHFKSRKNSVIYLFLSNCFQTGSTVLVIITSFAFSSIVVDRFSASQWSKYEILVQDIFQSLPNEEIETTLREGDTAVVLQTVNEQKIDEKITREIMKQDDQDINKSLLQNITSNVKDFSNNIIESTSSTVEVVASKVSEVANDTKVFISSTTSKLVKNRELAGDVFTKLIANADELIEAFSGILVAYLFKIIVLPLLIFLIASGFLKNSLRFKEY